MFAVSAMNAARPVIGYVPSADEGDRLSTGPRLPEDKVSLSPEARLSLALRPGRSSQEAAREGEGEGAGKDAGAAGGGGKPLTKDQERQVTELKQRDAHVRAHEAAHQAAGGELTGPATFSYELGPDGRSYAVGGGVPIAARTGRTPEETIAIARKVRAAALAPADPSAADLAAAATATQLEIRAQQQKRAEQQQARGQDPARGGPQAGTLERMVVRAPEPEQIF